MDSRSSVEVVAAPSSGILQMKQPVHETGLQTQGHKDVKARKLLKPVPCSKRVHEQQDQVQENSCPRSKRGREDYVDTLEDTRSTSIGRNKRKRIMQPTMHLYMIRTGSMITKITPRKKSSYVPGDTELRDALEDVMQTRNFCDAPLNETQVLRTLQRQNLYWKITPSRIKEILRKVE